MLVRHVTVSTLANSHTQGMLEMKILKVFTIMEGRDGGRIIQPRATQKARAVSHPGFFCGYGYFRNPIAFAIASALARIVSAVSVDFRTYSSFHSHRRFPSNVLSCFQTFARSHACCVLLTFPITCKKIYPHLQAAGLPSVLVVQPAISQEYYNCSGEQKHRNFNKVCHL